MDLENSIDRIQNCVIQIATPFSTGTGFYVHEFGAIVTSEHVVRDNRQVVVEGQLLARQMAEVYFVDQKFDLAFLRVKELHQMPDITFQRHRDHHIGDRVIALGHPYGSGFTATAGILSNLNASIRGLPYIQHDATLSPGNSGGPLIDEAGNIIGVNSFVKRGEQLLGFALPSDVVVECLDQFRSLEADAKAVRCISCAHIIHEGIEVKKYCSVCGSRIHFISGLPEYQASGVAKTVEDVIQDLGYQVELTRRGLNQWEIVRGSALITLSYHEKSGIIIGESTLCELSEEGISKIYRYLLQQNAHLRGLSFSVKGLKVILSMIIHDQYLMETSAREMIRGLFEKSDNYDDILIQRFGAVAVSTPSTG